MYDFVLFLPSDLIYNKKLKLHLFQLFAIFIKNYNKNKWTQYYLNYWN